eukprot:TRINITY_DN1072_c0_g1_i16.p1 TRINITY_DN1072_c0_g1~~TRINITY_DN1072_c0_g1_i16.p1  ORF type:complete len:105 (-),score=12.48 TRINITY_DN1072_c0_g1_i16:115-429(-)
MIDKMHQFLSETSRHYHGKISDEEAKERLTGKEENSYLIRDSGRAPGKITISYIKNGKVKNKRVTVRAEGYEYEGKLYKTITELIGKSKLREVCIHPTAGPFMY